MKLRCLNLFLTIIVCLGLSTVAWAGSHGRKADKKVGILLVAFVGAADSMGSGGRSRRTDHRTDGYPFFFCSEAAG